jgi:hypothetical protein
MSWCGRVEDVPKERPTLICLIDPSLPEEAAWKIGAGAEEEGVFLSFARAGGTPEALSLAASRRSRLDVGVGASAGGLAAAIARVTDHPYVSVGSADPAHLRWIGAVAACLAKGEPIPPRPGGEKGETAPVVSAKSADSSPSPLFAAPEAPGAVDADPLLPRSFEASPLEDRYAGTPAAGGRDAGESLSPFGSEIPKPPRIFPDDAAPSGESTVEELTRAITAQILLRLNESERGR